jgi:hypothetical protein
MTINIAANGAVELAGSCPVEDAEVLLQYLLATPEASVDWSACEWAHTAVIQVLLAARIAPSGTPKGGFLRNHLGRVLDRGSS